MFVDHHARSLPESSVEDANLPENPTAPKCKGSNCEHNRCKECFDLDAKNYLIARCSGEVVDEDEYLNWVFYKETARMTWDGK